MGQNVWVKTIVTLDNIWSDDGCIFFADLV